MLSRPQGQIIYAKWKQGRSVTEIGRRHYINCRSAILNLIKFNFLWYIDLYLKLHILFNGNGLAIWSSFPDITQKNNDQ